MVIVVGKEVGVVFPVHVSVEVETAVLLGIEMVVNIFDHVSVAAEVLALVIEEVLVVGIIVNITLVSEAVVRSVWGVFDHV